MRTLVVVGWLLARCATTAAAEPVRFEQYTWTAHDEGLRVLPYLGRPAMYLERGTATVDGVLLEDGTIEFDVALQNFPSFAGLTFRGISPDDYEVVYVRPQRSRQPDAVQYTPVFGGTEAWQLYVGEGYTAAADLPTGRWMHIKVIVSGAEARVFVDGALEPQLTVRELKRPRTRGAVGLFGRYGAMFSHVSITPAASAAQTTAAPPAAADPGVISRWQLGPSWDASEVAVDQLPARAATLPWEVVETEPSGLLNIARYRRQLPPETRPKDTDGQDVALARVILTADTAKRARLTFGYSDQITIFLNGRPLFSGNARYLSRDSAYLGTVTLDRDAVYLELAAGRNELLVAVTEAFGGWGLTAKLEGVSGVRVTDRP